MPARSPTRDAAEKLCKKFPDTPTRTLAKKLADSHQVTVESARCMIRTIRGNHGDRNRKKIASDELFRANQPAGWKPQMPESLSEEWTPFSLGNGIKVAIISDVHIPYHSKIAFESAVKYLKKGKPDCLLVNGDFADFYSISRHQKDPSKRDFKQEIELVQQGFEWLRYQFGKNCRIVFKLGNHEDRFAHWLWNQAPEISDFDRMSVGDWVNAPKWGIEVVGDGRPVMIGNLPALHGHESGKFGLTTGVNSARGLFLKCLSAAIAGHGHRTSQNVDPDMWHKQTPTWTTGCLCELNPSWFRVANRWNHGAAKVEVDSEGGFSVDNFRISPDGEIWK